MCVDIARMYEEGPGASRRGSSASASGSVGGGVWAPHVGAGRLAARWSGVRTHGRAGRGMRTPVRLRRRRSFSPSGRCFYYYNYPPLIADTLEMIVRWAILRSVLLRTDGRTGRADPPSGRSSSRLSPVFLLADNDNKNAQIWDQTSFCSRRLIGTEQLAPSTHFAASRRLHLETDLEENKWRPGIL